MVSKLQENTKSIVMMKIFILYTCILHTFCIRDATDKCNRGWQKLGCLHDRVIPDRPLPNELLNRRDRINHNNDGYFINRQNYNNSLHALACKCADLAFKKKYPYFGLQFYGECWSGPQNPIYNRDGIAESGRCLNGDYQKCDDNDNRECIGKAFTNYIYKLGDFKMIIDGKWSDWSMWSPCSKSCNGGQRTRFRTCTNPSPKNGGAECSGDSQETGKCNEEECYPECKRKMEIAFALDTSGSVNRKEWNKTLEFVTILSDKFAINPSTIHVGVVQFARRVYLSFKPSDSFYWSNEAVDKKVKSIKHKHGATRIDLAIDYVRENFFCEKCGVRKDIPKVLIVVTDGYNSVDGVLGPAALKMRQTGESLLAVGVGPFVGQYELEKIAGSAERTVSVENYDNLYSYLDKILKITCEAT